MVINTPSKRLMWKRDCRLLTSVAEFTAPLGVVVFNPEQGDFVLKRLVKEAIGQVSDVFVETPDLVVMLVKPGTSLNEVAYEITKARSRFGDVYVYNVSDFPLAPLRETKE